MWIQNVCFSRLGGFSSLVPSRLGRCGRACRRRRFVVWATKEVPWEFGFQCNERYLKWNRSAQSQLVKLVVMEKLNLTPEQMRSRLSEVAAVLPDLSERLGTIQAQLLVELVRDPSGIADRVLMLKNLLPNMNVADAVRRYPELVACHSESELRFHVQRLIDAFHGDVFQVGELLSKEPRCLKIELQEALEEVERLMPGCHDPLSMFMNDPRQFLSMEILGLESSN